MLLLHIISIFEKEIWIFCTVNVASLQYLEYFRNSTNLRRMERKELSYIDIVLYVIRPFMNQTFPAIFSRT
jgi:hypothetical protein